MSGWATILSLVLILPSARSQGNPWLSSGRCGPEHPLPTGEPGQCDPTAWENEVGPCCSSLGWCGNSDAHCKCSGCIDYRDNSTGPDRICADMVEGRNTVCQNWTDHASCGREYVDNTETAEACRELCAQRKDPPCSHWVWAHLNSGIWAKQCMLVEDMKGTVRSIESNTVTGTCVPPESRVVSSIVVIVSLIYTGLSALFWQFFQHVAASL